MIENITYGEMTELPGVEMIPAKIGQPHFPAHAFRIKSGKLIVHSAWAIPVVDNKTCFQAFTDVHVSKSEFLLNTDLNATTPIRDALMLSYMPSYYHFLIYRLPALAYLDDAEQDGSINVITISRLLDRMISPVDGLTLELANNRRMVRVQASPGVYNVENLIVPQIRNPWFGAYFNRTVMLPFLLKKSGLANTIEAMSDMKLFVRRRADTRRLANEPEIEAWHLRRGYVPVDPGALEMHEQAALFARATHIVGAEGAAMTNLVFAPRTKFAAILANPTTATDTFFTDLLSRFGVEAKIVTGQFVDENDRARTADFTVSLDQIVALHAGVP